MHSCLAINARQLVLLRLGKLPCFYCGQRASTWVTTAEQLSPSCLVGLFFGQDCMPSKMALTLERGLWKHEQRLSASAGEEYLAGELQMYLVLHAAYSRKAQDEPQACVSCSRALGVQWRWCNYPSSEEMNNEASTPFLKSLLSIRALT